MEKNSKIQAVYQYLVTAEDKRWEWKFTLPRDKEVSKQELSQWEKTYPKIMQDADKIADLKININLSYIAYKLVMNKEYRERFLEEVHFFQNYFWYSNNKELQNYLGELKKILLSDKQETTVL